ncbi:DUF4097 domain-containing protein [Microbacterium sp. Marseille-Q6965]|uniref:DUF4097 domain-containing protein n=1 Tax=Microbacterium sp. Marseille-Q6965 TaxID=2965072 RepID=UPI0021B819D5|nr:DUF4097 domain-containing protein [Microbacterium sp. Marseille-Q6965]
MTTQLTPPPVTPQGPAPQSETARTGTRALAITVAVLGALGLVLSAIFTSISTVRQATRPDPVIQSLGNVDGIAGIDVDTSRGDLRITFGEGDEVELESHSSAGTEWRLERDGDRLVISDSAPFDWRIGWSWDWIGQENSATLTLPASLEGTDLDVVLGAGQVLAEGVFGEVGLDVSAGVAEIEGTADALDVTVGAGQAIVELADVRDVSFDLSAGHATGTLTGEAPDTVEVDVSAGALDLTLPDSSYAVTTEEEAGQVDMNNLQRDFGAPRTVEVRVAAGHVDLRAG